MSGRELPAGWGQQKLKDLGTWRGGGTPTKAEPAYWENGNIPWVSPKDMKRAVIDDAEDHITEAAIDNSACNLVPAGSVLMVVRSGILAHSFPVATTIQPVTINQDMKALTPASGVVPEYLRLVLTAGKQSILQECSKAGTTVASISSEKLSEFEIPVPPSDEQRRIVGKIDELTARSRRAREALNSLPALIDRYRQSILTAAFRGDLTAEWRNGGAPEQPDTADERPDTLPPEWEWQRLDTSSAVSGGLTKNKNREQFPLRRPYLRVANVYANELRLEDVQEIGVAPQELSRVMLRSGDLLIVEGNGSLDQIGRVAIWDGQVPDCVHQNHIIKVRFPDRRIAELVLYWLISPFGRRLIEQEASSSAGLHTLSLSKISRLPIPVPSIDEAEAIVARIRAAFEGLSRVSVPIDAAAARLATLDQSILAKAFRGELVPQDPNDEPASVLLERIRAERAAAGPAPRRGRRPKVTGGG